MSVVTARRKHYQVEDRIMEAHAVSYRAYLARRDLPGPGPTFADFVEIRKLRYEMEAADSPQAP